MSVSWLTRKSDIKPGHFVVTFYDEAKNIGRSNARDAQPRAGFAVNADGVFEPATASVVTAFQSARHLMAGLAICATLGL